MAKKKQKKTKYRNPWYKGRRNDGADVKFFETDVEPVEYRGYLIYERIKGVQWDVVQNDVCIAQLAGPNGARQKVDELLHEKDAVNYAEHYCDDHHKDIEGIDDARYSAFYAGYIAAVRELKRKEPKQ